MSHEQEAPFAVQVELTEGCNLYCDFCGLRGIREKPMSNLKFMTVETATRLASQIAEAGWLPRVEFAMHGEPSLNPNRNEIVAVFRESLPRASLMMTSNGGAFVKDPDVTIAEIFEAGLNLLALDDYDYAKLVPKIRERYSGVIREYPADKDASPHRRRRCDEHEVVAIMDISLASEGNHSHLCNHAGAAAPKNDRGVGKRCAKPFRELAVRWDGTVAVCCNDWRGEYSVGSLVDRDLLGLWNGPEFGAARKALFHGLRDFGPCKGCDAKSYRVGLLPDKKGLDWLNEPDEDDRRVIAEVLARGPLTAPVLRKWELTIGATS